MKRHAYLKAVHKNPEQIKILLGLLDIEQNDLYVHIDSKSTSFDIDELKEYVKKAGICFVERTSVKWADYSIVNSTLIMLKAATEKESYAYYHLLSGQDLPLKPVSEINRYYDENDATYNYVGYDRDEKWTKEILYSRLDCYRKSIGPLTPVVKKIKSKLIHYVCGAAWFDINDELARLVIDNESWIKKHFTYFQFPDEAFLQTLIRKYKLQDSCRDYMRFIDWENTNEKASPYIFREKDFDRLIASDKNFARKFDMEQDERIVLKIRDHLMNGSGCKEDIRT